MAEKGAVYCDRTTRTNYYTALVSEEEYKLAEGTTYPAGKDVPQVRQGLHCVPVPGKESVPEGYPEIERLPEVPGEGRVGKRKQFDLFPQR